MLVGLDAFFPCGAVPDSGLLRRADIPEETHQQPEGLFFSGVRVRLGSGRGSCFTSTARSESLGRAVKNCPPKRLKSVAAAVVTRRTNRVPVLLRPTGQSVVRTVPSTRWKKAAQMFPSCRATSA